MATEKRFDQLVVVGASAGGIEALSSLVATLPSDFPAPIVIAQHLDPHRPSHLDSILAQRGALPVRSVAEREHLQPGVIYVVPSNRNVQITDSEVSVVSVSAGHLKPSIDLLFRTAAQVFGERLIAVVLTGSGSDGAAGARDVKEAGGMVVIQNPETASYPGMPESLAPTTVDIVANLENIGPLLHDVLTGVYLPTQSDDHPMLQAFLEQLRDNSGIDFTSYKTPTIMRRLQRRMAATGMERLPDYIRYIQQHPEEYQRLISSFLIKVTEFFRDPELFAYLREHVLPELVIEARRHGNELRLWSAGCATGEEAYSLAILLAETLGEELEQYNVRIFATDLDGEAVAFARRGLYPASALDGLSADLIARYFNEISGEYEIKKRVRALTVFGQHDLGQRAPFPRIDLALCRNVLIYFTTELQKRALQLFAFSLRNGGYLVLGKAETATPLSEFFALDHPQLRLYSRQGDRMLIPSARIKDTTPMPPARLVTTRRLPTSLEFARAQREAQRVRTSGEKLGALVLGLPVGVVVVDRHYDIQAINNAARRLLGIHSPALGEDMIHLAQNVPTAPLRAAIDAALRGEGHDRASAVVPAELSAGETIDVQITCHAQTTDGEDGPTDLVTILASDVTEMVRARRELEQAMARQQDESTRVQEQMQRLAETNRQLLEANQELASSNIELRSANEEFLVSNEELQAASEEVETLNEELQATNEELETLNEELQATVEELNTTNDDLQARSVEMQELAVSQETQRRESETARARLEAILVSIADAVLVVDGQGRPVLTNAAYQQMFGAGFAPEDENGQPLPAEQSPQQRVARGESFSMQFVTTEPGTQVRRWFEANGQRISGDGAERGVIIIRDITERSLRRLQDEFLAMASHELRTPLTPIRGYLQMLLRRLRSHPEETAQHYATLALEQVDRLNKLINDLLDVTRLQTGKLTVTLEPVDLAALARRMGEVTQVMADGHTIHIEAPDDAVMVNGDAARLEQIMLNLLTNAIRYAPDSQRIDVRLRRAGGEVELQVQDYGPGIATADLPNLFSRFYQVEHGRHTAGEDGGLGLGLYITRELVTAHGGHIAVESTLGQGATFTVRLPVLDE